jgi:hypothetical protein
MSVSCSPLGTGECLANVTDRTKRSATSSASTISVRCMRSGAASPKMPRRRWIGTGAPPRAAISMPRSKSE